MIPSPGMTLAGLRILGAFKLAMRDLGIPEHPGGKCPAQPCTCAGLSDAIYERAAMLVSDPDFEDSAVCADCRVLVPFTAACYAVDSSGVCVPCGQRRGLGDEYRLP
jgi:hypothetical protein